MKEPASKRQINGAHYRDCAIQPSEYIYRNKLGWCEGNAVKYITRHARKNGRQDIEKAIHYLELLLEWQYGETTSPPNAVAPVTRFRTGSDGFDCDFPNIPKPDAKDR